MSNLSITEAPRTPEYIANTSQSGGTSESQGVHEGGVLGVGDNVETSGNNGMPKLTPILYEIKEGDSLTKIAAEFDLKITDLLQQLKDSGKLPKEPQGPRAADIKDSAVYARIYAKARLYGGGLRGRPYKKAGQGRRGGLYKRLFALVQVAASSLGRGRAAVGRHLVAAVARQKGAPQL